VAGGSQKKKILKKEKKTVLAVIDSWERLINNNYPDEKKSAQYF
jgi:hypothetical protein